MRGWGGGGELRMAWPSPSATLPPPFRSKTAIFGVRFTIFSLFSFFTHFYVGSRLPPTTSTRFCVSPPPPPAPVLLPFPDETACTRRRREWTNGQEGTAEFAGSVAD